MLKEVVARCRIADSNTAAEVAFRSGKQFSADFDAKEYDCKV
jgi:hypothetical protein